MQDSHAEYVAAVREALEADEIKVRSHDVSRHGRERSARITLEPEQEDCAFTDLEEIVLDWDETTGWRLTPVYEASVGIGAVPIYRGIDVLPTTEVITAWVGTVITNPEVIASRGEASLRSTADDDLDFDAVLPARNSSN